MKKVIFYLRGMTQNESTSGNSLEHQEKQLKQYCASKRYKVVGVFTDTCSAADFNRAGFKALLAFVSKNKGKIDKLVFTRWDRFTRNSSDGIAMLSDLKDLGIQCEAVEQSLDINKPEGRLQLMCYILW